MAQVTNGVKYDTDARKQAHNRFKKPIEVLFQRTTLLKESSKLYPFLIYNCKRINYALHMRDQLLKQSYHAQGEKT